MAGVGIVLDSSILIALERGGGQVPTSWLSQELGLAAITAAELLAGVHRAEAAHAATRAAFVEGVLAAIPTLPFGLTEARVYAQIEAELARAGTLIDRADLEIGATALARGWAVATLNAADFVRIRGLQVWGPEQLQDDPPSTTAS